jgi:hypothetical protein
MDAFGLKTADFLNVLGLSLDFLGIGGIWVFGLPDAVTLDQGSELLAAKSHVEGNPYSVWAYVSMDLILVGFGLQIYAVIAF